MIPFSEFQQDVYGVGSHDHCFGERLDSVLEKVITAENEVVTYPLPLFAQIGSQKKKPSKTPPSRR